MPYVSNWMRHRLDKVVESLKDAEPTGELNYVLFAYCKRHITPSYNNYKNFIGELRQCATEIERKILAPYEDEKIKENGDVT